MNLTLPIHLPTTRPAAPRTSYLLFGALLAALTVIALAPGLLGPSFDGGLYALTGGRIAAGAVPYVDVWAEKPPGIYLVNALGNLVSGSAGSWQAAWVISVVAVVLTGIVVADTLRGIGWRAAAWIAGATCAVALASFPLARGGGLTETLAVFPAVVTIRLVGVGPLTAGRTFLAGVLVGLATAISLVTAPVLLATLAIVALRMGRTELPSTLSRMGWVVVGAGTAWAALFGALGLAGVPPAAAFALLRFNAAFSSLADGPLLSEALHGFLVLSPLAAAALLGVNRAVRSPRLRPLAVGALLWIAASIVSIVALGRMEVHYLAPLAVPLSLLLPTGLPGRVRARGLGLVGAGLVASLLLAAASVSVILISAETAIALGVRSHQATRAEAVVTWIDSQVPDGTLFVWGNQPHLYTLSQRDPASQYVYLLPLMTPGFTSRQMVSDVVDRWEKEPPAVIVDAGSAAPGTPGMPALLIARAITVGDQRAADLLQPIREFVRERYVLAETVEGWPIYMPR